jgi:hypothetical protein
LASSSYQHVLDEQLLASGQVRFFGMSDCLTEQPGGCQFVSRLTGKATTVRVRRRVVDARYLEVSIAAIDWIPATCTAQRAQATWLADPDLSACLEEARLNVAGGIGDHLTDPRMKRALARWSVNAEPAVTNPQRLQAQHQ